MKLYAALLAGLVACGVVMAQEGAAAGTTAPATTEKAAPAKKAPAAKTMSVAGTVVSVDAIANTVIVEKKVKKAMVQDTLYTSEKTKMAKGKTLADLKAGDMVSASYKVEDGKMMASSITVKMAPKAKAMKKEAAPAAAPEAPKAGEAK